MAEIVNMPKLGFDMAEGTLVRWVKAEGDSIEHGEVLAEIETDKATIEVESQATGVVRKHLVDEGTAVPVGLPIAVVAAADEEIDLDSLVGRAKSEPQASGAPTETGQQPPRSAPQETAPTTADVGGNGHLPDGLKASPVARRLASEQKVDLRALSGSGPGGRIVKRDVEGVLAGGPGAAAEAPLIGMPSAPERETQRVPVSRLRSTIGRRMTASKQQVPHFYVTADIDAGPMMALREDMNEAYPGSPKLSVNDFVVRAAALALRDFPNLNASLEDDTIIRHGDINIGMAVAVEEGLLTVVVRHADLKPLRSISQEARPMFERARSGRVRPDDVEGSTFTVSNLGMFDVDSFIAIINPPEAAILAVGSVRTVPVVADGEVAVGERMKATIAADHRVTDGAEAARWLALFRTLIEEPMKLVM